MSFGRLLVGRLVYDIKEAIAAHQMDSQVFETATERGAVVATCRIQSENIVLNIV